MQKMETDLFYLEQLDSSINSYELKMFRVQHEETQLSSYLKKYARTHQENSINKIYFVRRASTGHLVGWFGLKAATLPYNNKNESFLIPAVELTHFAVDERYKKTEIQNPFPRPGEYIFGNYILPIVYDISGKIACKDLFVFAINAPKLIHYYKERLGFKEMSNIDDKQFFEYAAPNYDEGCKFLYFPL